MVTTEHIGYHAFGKHLPFHTQTYFSCAGFSYFLLFEVFLQLVKKKNLITSM